MFSWLCLATLTGKTDSVPSNGNQASFQHSLFRLHNGIETSNAVVLRF